MNSLGLLLRQIPKWVKIVQKEGVSARVFGSPQKASGLTAGNFSLEIRLLTSGGVSVAEIEGQSRLPILCPERHINPGASFCISYGSTELLADEQAADNWWEHLRMFLVHQGYADKYGVWPLEGGLCHGDAALLQEQMEEIATSLGWRNEVLVALFRNKGWLANALPRASRGLDRLLNARTPCPRGCVRKDGTHHKGVCLTESREDGTTQNEQPILRAECPNRVVLERIALLEHRRKKMEQDFIKELKDDNRECCGTMKNCPLAKPVEAS